jgi:DNA-binding beta-propeller fold protein YncE
MKTHGKAFAGVMSMLFGIVCSLALVAGQPLRAISGTVWVANRGDNTIRAFDTTTGDTSITIAMAAGSQPGDLAYAKGKVYVTEEQGATPAIAIVDLQSGNIGRIFTGIGTRPHHVHASTSGELVAVGLYGTDMVAVVDTRDDLLLGPWDTNPNTTSGRVHAAVFSQDDNTLYLANEGANELCAMDPRTGSVLWTMEVPAIHELATTHNGKIAYVTRRGANRLAVVNLETHTYTDVLAVGLPDTLQLTANEKVLTVGLRTSPAQVAVVNTETFTYDIVTLSVPGAPTVAGHQWTSLNGRYTFASFEGPGAGVAVIDHFAGNRIVQRLLYPGRPHGIDHSEQ